jgi:hypothetical protein
MQLNNLPVRVNWPIVLVLIFSFSIHIFVNIKIKLFKVKQKHSSNVLTFPEHLKFGDLTSMDNRTISDFLTNLLTAAAVSTIFMTSLIINRTNPVELTKVTFLH